MLRTISSTSSFLFRDRQLDVRRIADSLGASFIVDGSVQKVGARVQLVLSLVDGRTGTVRWTHVSEDIGRGLPADHAPLANLIAGVLGVRLPDARRATSGTPEAALIPVSERRLAAIELERRSRQQVLYRTSEGRRQAMALLTSAINADSTFAYAHAHLAALLSISEPYTRGTRREQLAVAEAAARKALRIDSTLAEAHYGLGRVLTADYRLEQAREEYQHALRLDPTHSVVREYLTHLYIFLEQPGEALEEARRAVQDDPLSPNAISELARALLVNGRCAEALEVLARLRHLQPPPARAANITALCHLQLGSPREAIAAQRPMAMRNATQALGWLGFILARAGETAEALAIRDTLMAVMPEEPRAFQVALVSAGLGDFDAAFMWLDLAFEERSLQFDVMAPVLAELHSDPRFDVLRARLRHTQGASSSP